jgi:hypothetical protein
VPTSSHTRELTGQTVNYFRLVLKGAIVSHEKLYETLSSCQIDCIAVENVQLSTYNMTRPNLAQQELLARVGLINLLNRDVVELAKSMTNNGDEV